MSYPIIVCVVAIEALNLVLPWAALRRRMSRVARPFVAYCGVSAAWGVWILVIVVRGPAWMTALAVLGMAVTTVAMAVAIHLATREEEDRQDGGAGGAATSGPEAPPGGGDDQPLWWPAFEQQMAAYAARRDRERQPVEC